MDDNLVSVAAVAQRNDGDLERALASHTPGDEVEIIYERAGKQVQAKAKLLGSAHYYLTPVESPGSAPPEQQWRFRRSWLISSHPRTPEQALPKSTSFPTRRGSSPVSYEFADCDPLAD